MTEGTATGFRVVLDTNVVIRAFINLDSESGRVFEICERRQVVPLLSRAVLDEYRLTITDAELQQRYPQLSRPEVNIGLERLLYVGDFLRRITTRFPYPRDPRDSHLIELAIAGNASHLITVDNDLLDLQAGRNEAAKRFRQRLPRIHVLRPHEFIARYEPLFPRA